MGQLKSYLGETLGTYILTLIGCSSVALAVLFDLFSSIFPIALIWGIGVTIAIYATKNYSKAHLNPAVSVGFFILGKIKTKELLINVFAQLMGGFLAGLSVYLIFRNYIQVFEANHTNANEALVFTASIFGEFFPNPGYEGLTDLSFKMAAVYEWIGALLLMGSIIVILRYKSSRRLAPVWIGLVVSILIMILAPYTQCGINPARDFGPRLVAYILHWGDYAFPQPKHSFFSVYILAPIIGAGTIAFFADFLKKRI